MRGQVRLCEDPRNRSGGRGGHHYVVLLKEHESSEWTVAVIESSPRSPIYTLDKLAAAQAGLSEGSGIQLPVARVPSARLLDKRGALSALVLARLEGAIVAAAAEDASPAAPTDET